MVKSKILIVDDDSHLLAALRQLLEGEGYEVACADSAEAALDRCRVDSFHVVLCDLHLPGRNGISLIKTLRDVCPSTATVLITAHGTVRSAIAALKSGAVEYMAKPIKPKRLATLCASLTASAPEFLPNHLRSGQHAEASSFEGITARSPAMRIVLERLQLAAAADTPVLLTGESGVGKEFAARAIHRRSTRAAGPFVVLTAGALPRERIAIELFGGERDATSTPQGRPTSLVEDAEGGTLFIDEIAALDDASQRGLARLLETRRLPRSGSRRERSADVRIIAASSQESTASTGTSPLRADLRFRLSAFVIELPPLRERREDVPLLATELTLELARIHGRAVMALAADTQRLLSAYAWPGNVRELRNVIERAVLLTRGPSLEASLLPPEMQRKTGGVALIKIAIGTPMENIEREVILRTLEANQGNKTATAGVLGISRRSIYNKLASYGV